MLTLTHPPRYLLGSGYSSRSKVPFGAEKFFDIWQENIIRYAWPRPQKVLVVSDNSIPPENTIRADWTTWLRCDGNLGHVRDKDEGRTNHYITGWAGSMLTAAMVAFNSEMDFVYQEQDCLGFGPYITQLYEDMGDGFMTIGGPLGPPHTQLTSSQSLFIVRHHYIPIFVMHYLAAGPDHSKPGMYGEQKFSKMKLHDLRIKVTGTWNCDRNRPLPFHAKVWAAQQWTQAELEEAAKQNLLYI